jgi:D-lactate dehydrogenase (cytochrome)
VAEQAETVKAIAGDYGGDDFRWATTPEQRSKLWQARHDAYYAALALRPGSKGLATDVCVPISRLAECIVETKRDLEQSPIPYALVGHVGDGNFHLVFMLDPNRPEELAEANRLNERMVNRALAMEGTSTGEHGVGYGKMNFLIAEHGEAVGVMRTIKMALDPDGILNPGKIVRI